MFEQERNIIRCVLGGDSEAFGILMDWYAPRVFSLVVKISQQDADAEEITQDVMLKAYRKLDTFDGRSAFSTWLYRIAYNEALSFARRANRKEVTVDEADLRAVSDAGVESLLDTPGDDPRLKALPEALEMLSADERSVITLFYYEEMSLKDVAEVTGLTLANVKVKLSRTRKKLYVLINRIALKYE